jgi:predicted branched-subunit amino acid permease
MQRTTYMDGARRAWPLAVAVGGFGLTYGVLARQAGFGAAAIIVFSLTTFAGSAQFAAASIVDDGGTVVAASVVCLAGLRRGQGRA